MSGEQTVGLIILALCGLYGAWEMYMMTCRTDRYLAVRQHKADQRRKDVAGGLTVGFRLLKWFIK